MSTSLSELINEVLEDDATPPLRKEVAMVSIHVIPPISCASCLSAVMQSLGVLWQIIVDK